MIVPHRLAITGSQLQNRNYRTMKISGFLLLVSGFAIVLAALSSLRGGALPVFILLGIGVEVLGFVLVAKAHLPTTEDRR